MDNQSGHVMTLANSIIGVSILAMPYCFKQCGIVLSLLMLLVSSIISRLACHFLLKSAIIARRKTFEFLAFHIFGSMGKLAIEIGIIGFLLGTCIAFFVVMGDLGPEIIAEMTGIYSTNTMRTSILMALALFCVLPLGLLRNVDSLNGVSRATIGFYCCLVLKIILEAFPHIFAGDWYDNVELWRPAGIMQCLPIFSMALFCQTQLFEIYQALPNATLERMNNVVRIAVNICTLVYICVGVFGYIAFSHKQFTGNILLSFSPSLMTDVMKIGFVLSVAFSFPLVIFPCRASLYSLFYKEGYSVHEGMSNYIPEGKFKGLTMFIVFISLIIGIMIPNIELVLGLVGSTIGVMICVLFPVTCFICISPKNTNERILAQLMLMIGVFVMVLGTYKNVHSLDKLEINTVTISSFKSLDQMDLSAAKVVEKLELPKDVVEKVPTTMKPMKVESINKVEKVKADVSTLKMAESDQIKEIRHEPPQPIEPQEVVNEIKEVEFKEDIKPVENNDVGNKKPSEPSVVTEKPVQLAKKVASISKNEQKNDEVDIEAIKKEDKEVELQEKEKIKDGDTKQVLIDAIQKQHEFQKEIVEQNKQLIEVLKSQQKNVERDDVDKVKEEKLKAVKEIESIALKAIEKISGGKDSEKVVADAEKSIEKKVAEKVKEQIELDQNREESQKKDDKKPASFKESKVGELPVIKPLAEVESVPVIKLKPEDEAAKVTEPPKIAPLKKDNIPNVEEKQENNSAEILVKAKGNSTKEAAIQIKNPISKVASSETINAEVKEGLDKFEQKSVNNKENIGSQSKRDIPKSDVQSHNDNNTAPLFLKLGKPEGKVVEGDLNKMVPLPLAVSSNLVKDYNLSKVDSSSPKPNKAEAPQEQKDVPPVDKDELQSIRRDILMLKSKK